MENIERPFIMKIPASLRLLPRSKHIPTAQRIETMTGVALENYLKDFSPEEIRQARELWTKHAARKELIQFEANSESSLRL